MRRTSSVLPLLIATATALLSACRGDSSTAPTPVPPPTATVKPGLKILAGAGATDTINAQPLQSLVVEVRGPDSLPARGTVVRFEVQRTTDTTRRGYATMHACSVSEPVCGQFPGADWQSVASDTVDAKGKVSALLRFGTIAGRAVVRIVVPDFAYSDSAIYTVTPGAAAAVRLAGATTMLSIGRTKSMRGAIVDRWGNLRSELPTVSSTSGSALSLDATTGAATGLALGTETVYASFGTLKDSTIVTVVPQGRLLVWSASNGSVRMIDIDGTDARTVISSVGSDLGTFPQFDQARQQVTLHRGTFSTGGPATVIVVIDTSGVAKREISSGVLGNVYAQRRMADGSIRVVAGVTGFPDGTLSSILPDGTVVQLLNLPGMLDIYGGADISPDGSKVAYLTAGARGAELRALDVATAAGVTLAPAARAPRWSASGDRVAYLDPTSINGFGLDGTLNVVNADGSGWRLINAAGFSPGLSWSPDGTYVIGRNNIGALQVTRVSDGVAVRLQLGDPAFNNGTFDDLFQPDWR
ncbi:MAG: hypothetical protein IT355_11330 [Gemmatimonadaceae bacterium]|nr:hypothetical protein [Gemmatimonadaceae bacterium]